MIMKLSNLIQLQSTECHPGFLDSLLLQVDRLTNDATVSFAVHYNISKLSQSSFVICISAPSEARNSQPVLTVAHSLFDDLSGTQTSVGTFF